MSNKSVQIEKRRRNNRSQAQRRDWVGELQQLITRNNALDAKREKIESFETQHKRACALFRILRLLRRAGFKLYPDSLRGCHIEFLMWYWTTDWRAEEGLRARGSALTLLPKPYSAAHIQLQLSFLRAPAEWIGKPGLVRPATRYVSDAALVSRPKKSKQADEIPRTDAERQTLLDRIAATDPFVALQFELRLVFKLSRKESVMFCPAQAEVPAGALPEGIRAGDHTSFLCIDRGTRTRKARFVPIHTDEQRRVLARALEAAPRPGMHISRPGHDLKQALARFTYVVRRAHQACLDHAAAQN